MGELNNIKRENTQTDKRHNNLGEHTYTLQK